MATPADTDAAKQGGMNAAFKRALTWFLAFDAIFVAGAVTLYFWIVRPQMAALELARDNAVRNGMAMTVRVHAVEGRLALAVGDPAGAKVAAEDVRTGLTGLLRVVPKDRTAEAGEVTNLVSRAGLIVDELARDPQSARKDFELIDARLSATYAPAPAGP
jgi:hypothetical protein